jgi:lipopolysaccharide/colanic/teichoic acid biosynthesis glycosyltransferase
MRDRTPAEILVEQRTIEIQGFLEKHASDLRVTPFGRFIRSTSLDELPQIVNVALGQMSFVGPRPVMPQMTKPFPNFQSARLLVKPGITGLWQIRDRQNSSHVSFMWAHDLEYVRTCSFVVDTSTLLRTLPSVILKRGAY